MAESKSETLDQIQERRKREKQEKRNKGKEHHHVQAAKNKHKRAPLLITPAANDDIEPSDTEEKSSELYCTLLPAGL